MIKQAWIAVGLAALIVGCGGAGGGSGLGGSKTGSSSTAGATAGSGSTGGSSTSGSLTSGSTSGTTGSVSSSTGGSSATTGGTTGSTSGSSVGSTGGSSAGSTTGTSSASTSGSTGSSTAGSTGGSTGGSATTGGSIDSTTGGSTGSATGGTVDVIVSDDPGTTGGGSTGSSTDGGTSGGTTSGSDAGTTGGGAGSTSGGTAGGPIGDWGHSNAVYLKVYEVDLTGPAGNVVVFSDPEGMLIDIKRLRDKQGPRFLFLNRKSIPFGSYSGATVVVGDIFTVMAAGQSKGTAKQFAPSLSDGSGHALLQYTFDKTVTVGGASNTVVVNFDLEHWQDKNNVVTPHLHQGKALGLSDPNRQEQAKLTGQVSNLIYGQSFLLKHDAHSTYLVTFSPSTQFVGGGTKNTKALANAQHVMVDGYWDASAGNFVANSVKVQSEL